MIWCNGALNNKLVQYSNGPNLSDCWMVCYTGLWYGYWPSPLLPLFWAFSVKPPTSRDHAIYLCVTYLRILPQPVNSTYNKMQHSRSRQFRLRYSNGPKTRNVKNSPNNSNNILFCLVFEGHTHLWCHFWYLVTNHLSTRHIWTIWNLD